MRRRLIFLFVILAVAGVGGVAGWTLRDMRGKADCRFLDHGYVLLHGDLIALAKYPLEQVGDPVVANIQRCWALRPYHGPQDPIYLTDARRISASRYYLLFTPLFTTDVWIVFLVDGNEVRAAYQYGVLDEEVVR